MSVQDLLPDDLKDKYAIYDRREGGHALHGRHRAEWDDIMDVLRQFQLLRSEIEAPGGNLSPIAKRLYALFRERGWKGERNFRVKRTIEELEGKKVVGTWNTTSQTHALDFGKGVVGLEVEWNSKDSVFSRDLTAWRELHELGIIEVGVVITRASELQTLFKELGFGSKYGESTTHMRKLFQRIDGGSGGFCPIVAIGITRNAYKDDGPYINTGGAGGTDPGDEDDGDMDLDGEPDDVDEDDDDDI